MEKTEQVTVLLNAASADHQEAPGKLLEVSYDDIRRLFDWQTVSWQSRAQFFAVAARVMRRVLMDHARGERAQKHSHGQKVAYDKVMSFPAHRQIDLLALEEALMSLQNADARQAKIVQLGVLRRPLDRGDGARPRYLRNDYEARVGFRQGVVPARADKELKWGIRIGRR